MTLKSLVGEEAVTPNEPNNYIQRNDSAYIGLREVSL